jgi:limonene-1,2-epoxide hydrolase
MIKVTKKFLKMEERSNPYRSMHSNARLIHAFYEAFREKDYKSMQNAYHPEATFHDPVFQNLSSQEVKAMWQMLVTSATDLRIESSDITADDTSGKCLWQAWYTFTATGKKVHNIIYATFEFRDGKLFHHSDRFDFWRWSKMALGTPGLLLGWTPIIRNKVRQTARKRLEKFMKGM